ncbi:MAG: ATP-binding protein [bacterium]|nr:ATP-binding protein [bacterium]
MLKNNKVKQSELEDFKKIAIAEERYRKLFDTAEDGILLIDFKTEKIIDANAHLLGVLGYSLDEIIGKKFWEIGTFRDIQSAKVLFEELQFKGSIRHESLPLLTKDGQEIEVEFVSSVYSVGTVKTIQCNIRDITKRNKIANEVDKSRKDLEAFTYSVSHDLRAPLRAIDGFSKILVEEYTPKLDDEGKRIISVIGQSISLMEKLIDDLLILSRTGSQPMTTQEIEMSDMAKVVFEELKKSVPERKITVNFGVLPRAKVDPILMRQVWANLLSNAIKFTRLREEAIIDIGCKTENNMAVYSIKDNGVGFDMQYVGKLFQIFQQLHARGAYEGTGVGLAITKRIVERHDGKVWAEGKVDEGATFYFTLPAVH